MLRMRSGISPRYSFPIIVTGKETLTVIADSDLPFQVCFQTSMILASSSVYKNENHHSEAS